MEKGNWFVNLIRTQPVAVGNFVKFALSIAATFGVLGISVDDASYFSAQTVLLWGAIQGLIEIIVTMWTRVRVASKSTYEPMAEEVVQKIENGSTVAPKAKAAAYRSLPKSGIK